MVQTQTARSRVKDMLGRRLHDLRISVIDRCNLRCTYCMPAEDFHEHYEFLPDRDRLTFEEITRITRLFVRLGVSKLRVTGGEPLLRKNLPVLIAMLQEIEGLEDLALTTNGLLLAQQARALKDAGLRRVTVSLDTLDDAVFGRMNGRHVGTGAVLAGIQKAAEVGLVPIKINVVVQRGVNDDTVVVLAEHFKGKGHIVRFIEYMDVGTCNGWRYEHVVPSKDILARLREKHALIPLEENYHGEVAERYAYADGGGEIGFITSVTEPFCSTCTRARISPDGKLYTCLFADAGTDLRDPLRSGATDEELLDLIRNVWAARKDRYSELRAEASYAGNGRKKIEMYQIGG
ncbi:MAG: GTP 3',8-cyclase MoaA [Candidatus Hydrogenedentes bacterium]|nr:GTP 3',8-cyclase MoaA [Candidatus Hydrogenedentota bacterium]